MHQFSIITPTFNRVKYLPRLYDSLCRQGDVDFEWLIIDDGSTDDTKEVVTGFDKKINIKYIYKENGGKSSAMNLGFQAADSYISLVTLDSDDYLCDNALKKAWSYFDLKTGRFENDCACLSGLCQNEEGLVLGQKFPHDRYVSKLINYYKNERISGDKCLFSITDIIKQYSYPIFPNENYVLPSLVFNRISLTYNTLHVNDFFQVKEYLPGGLTSQQRIGIFDKNPHGSELFFNEGSMLCFGLKNQISYSSRYIYFSLKNNKKHIFANAKNKKIFFLGLLGFYMKQLKNKLFISKK